MIIISLLLNEEYGQNAYFIWKAHPTLEFRADFDSRILRVIPESHSNPILSKGDVQLLVERISNKWQITFFKCAVLFIFCASSGVVFYWKFYGERDKQKLSETASQIGKGALSDQELIDQGAFYDPLWSMNLWLMNYGL